MVIVNLALATICFLNQCYPALVGINTPEGEYKLVQLITDQPGYGGDVLKFTENETTWYAIHRVWLLKPKQHRLDRLSSNNAKDRVITAGCINVMPKVYEELKSCCSNDTLIIK